MKSTAKAAEKRSRTVVVLAIAVALMLLGSIFAQMFNTSFYKVKVSRISFIPTPAPFRACCTCPRAWTPPTRTPPS